MKAIKEKVVIGCGIWLIILPYMGFPRSWKSFLTVFTGLVLVYLGALLLRSFHKEKIMLPEAKREIHVDSI